MHLVKLLVKSISKNLKQTVAVLECKKVAWQQILTCEKVHRQQMIQLTFQELRKRLPPEVSDGVITLIMSSEEAMIDFAQLMTPEDIAVFNDKYNVDLQYPTQVA